MWFQEVEDTFMGIPAVEDGVGVSAQVAGGCRRDSLQEGRAGVAADHDAGLPVPGEQHAQPLHDQPPRIAGSVPVKPPPQITMRCTRLSPNTALELSATTAPHA